MIRGVANQVRKRFSQRVKDTLIEIRVLTRHFKHNVLVLLLGHVAYDARETAEKLVDGNHTDLHYGFLKLAEHARLKSQRIREFPAQRIFRMAALKFVDGALQHRFADNQFADQIHNRFDTRGVDAERILGRV